MFSHKATRGTKLIDALTVVRQLNSASFGQRTSINGELSNLCVFVGYFEPILYRTRIRTCNVPKKCYIRVNKPLVIFSNCNYKGHHPNHLDPVTGEPLQRCCQRNADPRYAHFFAAYRLYRHIDRGA